MNDVNLDATQGDETIEGVDQPLVVDSLTADSSADSGENHEEKSDGVQKRIDNLTAKRYQAEREAEGLRQENDRLKAEQAKPVVEVNTVDAPIPPADMYDQEQQAQYQRELVAYTQKVAQEASQNTYAEHQKTAREAQNQTEMQQVVSTYATNAIRDGVDMDKLRAAEQTLAQAGISSELGNYLMKDANGGRIAEYLHDNPSVMYEVLGMDVVSAGIKIANEIKPRVLSTTPRVSNAPDPIPEITGSGALNRDDFERNNPGTEFI
jgi:hypothetical protein